MTDARIILPPCEFSDDEEFVHWLEICRLTGLKAHDEMSENAAYVYAKLRRFALSEGMSRGPASRTARSVALPLARSAESLGNVASYMRLCGRRFEAFVEAAQRPKEIVSDFKIKGVRR